MVDQKVLMTFIFSRWVNNQKIFLAIQDGVGGGVIDNTGAFIAPAESGTVTITAKVGSVTKELALVITAAE